MPNEENKNYADNNSPLPESVLSGGLFRIDFINRLIRVSSAVNIATATKKFLKLSRDFFPSGVLKADATVVAVAGTAGETTLNTYTIPLNMISRNYAGGASASGPKDWRDAGNTFRIFAAGRYTTDDATANFSLKLEFNDGTSDTTYHTIASTGAVATNAPWWVDWTVIVPSIGSSGTAESFARAQINNVNKDSASTSANTLDTTKAQTIKLTATWTSGDAADGLSIRQFLVELLN